MFDPAITGKLNANVFVIVKILWLYVFLTYFAIPLLNTISYGISPSTNVNLLPETALEPTLVITPVEL